MLSVREFGLAISPVSQMLLQQTNKTLVGEWILAWVQIFLTGLKTFVLNTAVPKKYIHWGPESAI